MRTFGTAGITDSGSARFPGDITQNVMDECNPADVLGVRHLLPASAEIRIKRPSNVEACRVGNDQRPMIFQNKRFGV